MVHDIITDMSRPANEERQYDSTTHHHLYSSRDTEHIFTEAGENMTLNHRLNVTGSRLR